MLHPELAGNQAKVAYCLPGLRFYLKKERKEKPTECTTLGLCGPPGWIYQGLDSTGPFIGLFGSLFLNLAGIWTPWLFE